MSRSIRSYLFINLILSVIFVTFTSIVINLFFIHKKFDKNLDAKILSTFLLVKSAIQNVSMDELQKEISDAEEFRKNAIEQFRTGELLNYEKTSTNLQIWDANNKLILQTVGAPKRDFSNYPNSFSDFKEKNELGRAFVYHDPQTKYTIAITQNFNFADVLEDEIVNSTILTMVLTFPFIGLFIWLIVTKGLYSIAEIAQEVKTRLPNNLTPVSTAKVPIEIKPLTTELNNLFTKLQEAFSREKRFASDAAHELKTPLAALKIQAQVALHSDNKDEQQIALNNVVKGVDRSTHIINQLLTLSRAMPEAHTKKELVSLNKESITVITEILHFAKQKNIELELIAPEQPVYIEGNPITISVLIRNLTDNAIRYTPEKGLVQIIIESTPKNSILKVVDTGPGIPDDMKEKIFDRFFRILGNKETGCGLGLSIVKQIAQLHNAEIKVSDPSSGIGTEFAVIFPKPTKIS